MNTHHYHMDSEDNMSDVSDMFAEAQAMGNAINGLREDIGLSAGDTFLLEDTFSDEENMILNMEVTPQIEEIMAKAMFAHAFQEVTTWEQGKAEREASYASHIQNKAVFDRLIDIQENMAVVMPHIKRATQLRGKARADLDQWVKRYNTWKNTPAYQAYKNKKQAADLFFSQLETKKAKHAKLKELTQKLWDKWNLLKHQSDLVVQGNEFLWTWYFNLVEEEINLYFTNGDVEDVDDFSLLTGSQVEVMDLLCDSHYREQAQFDKPESGGIGFWDFAMEYKTLRTSARRTDKEDDLSDLLSYVDNMAA